MKLAASAGRMLMLAACAFAVSLASACSTLNAIGGGSSEPSVSPRTAVVAAADKVEPVIKEVTVLLAAGVVSNNVADDIRQYGPLLLRIADAYSAGARACLNTGGQLVTDTTTGGECTPSTLRGLYNAFDGEVLNWMIDASQRGDQDVANVILGARLVISLVPPPTPGGPFPGYRDEPDVSLVQYDARMVQLRETFLQMIAAANAVADRTS
jgi:hypothetical protein